MKRAIFLVVVGLVTLASCESIPLFLGKREVTVEVFVDTERYFIQVRTERDEKYCEVLPFYAVRVLSRRWVRKETPVMVGKEVVGWERLYLKLWPVSGRVLVEDGGRWKRVEQVREGGERSFGLVELQRRGAVEVIETEERVWFIIHVGALVDD